MLRLARLRASGGDIFANVNAAGAFARMLPASTAGKVAAGLG
jgi:hypothetical protein